MPWSTTQRIILALRKAVLAVPKRDPNFPLALAATETALRGMHAAHRHLGAMQCILCMYCLCLWRQSGQDALRDSSTQSTVRTERVLLLSTTRATKSSAPLYTYCLA